MKKVHYPHWSDEEAKSLFTPVRLSYLIWDGVWIQKEMGRVEAAHTLGPRLPSRTGSEAKLSESWCDPA